MSKIISVVPKDGYVLAISFSDGSTLNFSMKRQVNTVQFRSIRDAAVFRKVSFDDKSVLWQGSDDKPLRLMVDSIFIHAARRAVAALFSDGFQMGKDKWLKGREKCGTETAKL